MENFHEQLVLLPDYLSAHLLISMLALATGIAMSVPTAIVIAKWWRKGQWAVLTAAGVIQTVPSIAMLALMVLVFGIFGFLPAFIALMLYSILPILRNTTTAIASVDPSMTEAARGLGMTPWQSLWRVELPLAMPVIIAGVRTATVWVVGIATLSTPVGQPSLGNYIFAGLQLRNGVAVGFGVIAAAALAVVLDSLIALLQQGVEGRVRWKTFTSLALLVVLVGGGLLLPMANGLFKVERKAVASTQADATPTAAPGVGTIRIGAKTFTEQYILADLIARRLNAAGIKTDKSEGLGSGTGFDALADDNINIFVDYSGTIYANYMKREDIQPAWFVQNAAAGWLATMHDIHAMGSLGFENAYALAMTRQRAEELGIKTIADLAKHADELSIAGDYEFFGRPEWYKLRDAYGLNFNEKIPMDSTLMYEAVYQGKVDVITAFSSDGRIAAYDLVVLKDPRHAFPPYDAMLLLSPDISDNPAVIDALQPLVGGIPLKLMQQANQRVDVDGQTASQAAAWLDEQIGK